MTNTINNVPRELLERCAQYTPTLEKQEDRARALSELRALLSAPSPAGVDGLEGVSERIAKVWIGHAHIDDLITIGKEVDAAQAIIDGLRGEVAAQEETANQLRELALQFDRHRMTAMAHIRAAASGDKSAIEALGVFAALPPIPGHEITAEFDQQAQRIGELEGLLRRARALLPAAPNPGASDGKGGE